MAKSFFSWQWADGWEWGDGWQWCSISGKMADYLPHKEPDYDAEFPDLPVESLSENIDTECRIVETEDNDEERVAMSEPFFIVTLNFPQLSKNQIATLFDFYFNENKANGRINSFKWTHPTDNCTYVVRFDTDLESGLKRGFYADSFSIDLRVLGWDTLDLD